MAEGLTLIGFRDSVYTRIVRMALIEMGLDATYVEANPFAGEPDPALTPHTPFNRVPVLRHGDFTLTETAAIVRYLDHLSEKPSFVPAGARAAARMAQVVGIVDAYGYQPMVRHVFSQGFYRGYEGLEADTDLLFKGLVDSGPVLKMLDAIAQQGDVLEGATVTLADIHLGPMMAYFVMVSEGAQLLQKYPALSQWWAALAQRPSLTATDPFTQR